MAKFDKEYSTQFLEEKAFLDKCGVKYSFVKTIDGITTFKYAKTFELFQALADFYSEVYVSPSVNNKR